MNKIAHQRSILEFHIPQVHLHLWCSQLGEHQRGHHVVHMVLHDRLPSHSLADLQRSLWVSLLLGLHSTQESPQSVRPPRRHPIHLLVSRGRLVRLLQDLWSQHEPVHVCRRNQSLNSFSSSFIFSLQLIKLLWFYFLLKKMNFLVGRTNFANFLRNHKVNKYYSKFSHFKIIKI